MPGNFEIVRSRDRPILTITNSFSEARANAGTVSEVEQELVPSDQAVLTPHAFRASIDHQQFNKQHINSRIEWRRACSVLNVDQDTGKVSHDAVNATWILSR